MTAPLRTHPVPFVAGLSAHGDRPALVRPDRSVSYLELAALVAERAAVLGTTRRLVLLSPTPDVDSVVSYLACLAGGHPVLLTAPCAAPSLVERYDPDVLVLDGTLVARREGTTHGLHPDLALLLSTSGSTGSPKLVRLSADNLQANAEAIAASLGIRADDRAITSLPLHYCYGLSVLHSHLLAGASVVLTSLSVVDPCFWELFRAHGVTTLAGVPHTFALLERTGFGELDLPTLRYVTQAGGRLAPDRVRQLAELGQRRGWDLVVMYGQTEATARIAYLPADLALEHPCSIGVPVPGGSLRVEPADGLPDGVGELVYGGPNVMLGYATSPADLALGRVVHELRTGDLARIDDEGLVEVVGRSSRFVKVFGLRIDLDRVEAAVDAEVACLALGDELVVATPAGPEVRREVARAAGLPVTSVRHCPVPEIPRTAAGKVDVPALEQLAARRPAEPAGGSVREVLARVLERDDIAPHQSFVDLGGDSLSYVEASLLLEERLGHLPQGWHLLPVSALDAQRRPRARRSRTVETGVLLRAAAILLIVASHAGLIALLGGAHLLLGVAGHSFARFQLTAAPRRERCSRLLRSTARIALPAVLAIGVTTLLIGRYGLEHLLLVHDLVSPGMVMKDFWFVEVLVQLLLACAVLLVALDRVERRAPFLLPCALLGLALLARFGVLPALEGKTRLYAPYAIAWLFVWGWAAAKSSTTGQRLLLSVVLLAALPGFFFGNTARTLVVGGGLLLMLWVPALRVPRGVSRVAAGLAAASLYVYVTHVLVLAYLRPWPLLALAGSIALGLAYYRLCAPLLARLLPARSPG